MTQTSPADELRAAAEGFRLIEDDLPGWLRPLGEPLAQWLEAEAERIQIAAHPSRHETYAAPALAVARAINGSQP
ncbi:hypothetical protein [Streptosporangium amethystogenes]|uniref:hypothetical protein n=1 Tax=Streptosporangium amethystogenes TaxID=2002 RepID=UPI0004BDEAC9|nr:hypothetical protein [Streptosporangium amethystogenes]KUJ65417.1 hypothetical protein ACZ90_47945 [Streptomyces albus subsp. albus]